MIAALVLFVFMASRAGAAPSAAQVRHDAAVLESTLDAMTGRMNAERDAFALKTVALASVLKELGDAGSTDPKLLRLKEELDRAVREYHAATITEGVQATLMARRLGEFRQTGILPPVVRDDGSLARALGGDVPPAPNVRKLPLDLVALTKSLGLPAPARRRLPAPPPAIARRAPAFRPAPSFMPDRGAGRAEADPVPALIAQLSSGETGLRALAADELAGRGTAASSAVPALRRALSDSDPRVRSSSVTALGAIVAPDSAAIPDIRRLLADHSEDVRFSARTALQRLGLSR